MIFPVIFAINDQIYDHNSSHDLNRKFIFRFQQVHPIGLDEGDQQSTSPFLSAISANFQIVPIVITIADQHLVNHL